MRKSDFDLPIADEAPNSSTLTNYDEQHLLTYLRLLDAHAEGAEWDEAALLVLHIDPIRQPARARRAWESHLARAKWVVENGYAARTIPGRVANGKITLSMVLTAPPDQCSEDPIMSMSTASIPVFEIGLNALSAILNKAEAYAEAKKIDPTVLPDTRLFPDMFAFTRQVQSACDQAKNCAARLAGVEPPKYEDSEKTFTELKARIAKTVAYVKTLDAKKIDASADREITFPLGPNNKGHMKGADYLNHFSLPNFYFHLTTAYDILRHSGVEIGKRDFLGAIPMKIT